MRLGVVAAVALLLAPAAAAAPPNVAASASIRSGAAPLRVVFSASGDASSYHWAFGDGTAAEGSSVEHIYGAGAFRAQLTATSGTGEVSTKSFRINAFALALHGRTVVGCNVENAAYGVALCAECGLVSQLHITGGGRLTHFACVNSFIV